MVQNNYRIARNAVHALQGNKNNNGTCTMTRENSRTLL